MGKAGQPAPDALHFNLATPHSTPTAYGAVPAKIPERGDQLCPGRNPTLVCMSPQRRDPKPLVFLTLAVLLTSACSKHDPVQASTTKPEAPVVPVAKASAQDLSHDLVLTA